MRYASQFLVLVRYAVTYGRLRQRSNTPYGFMASSIWE
jgi:hypothetical protein